MNLLGCLDTPDRGRYCSTARRGRHRAVTRSPDAQRKIGFVFQGFNLLPARARSRTCELPLLYAALPRGRRERGAGRARARRPRRREHHEPTSCRAASSSAWPSRARWSTPALILADEPTGNLDTRTSVEIMALLQRLNREGLTIVLVTHEPDIARYASRVRSFAMAGC
jgi:putative ABC transport system ATP-binding protein